MIDNPKYYGDASPFIKEVTKTNNKKNWLG